MMNFRIIKQALFDTIKAAEAGQWQTIDYQRQRSDVEQAEGFNRTVEVIYGGGEFPKSRSTTHGPKGHNPVFELHLFVSAPAEGNISAAKDENATEAQRAAAMANFQVAAARADDSMDELIDYIYQTVMSAATRYLGLDKGVFDVLYIGGIEKSEPHDFGNLVALTAIMRVDCQEDEEVTGKTGTPSVSIDTDFSIEGDQGGNAGVEVDPTT